MTAARLHRQEFATAGHLYRSIETDIAHLAGMYGKRSHAYRDHEVGDRDWREVYPGLAAYPGEQFDYDAEDKLRQRLR